MVKRFTPIVYTKRRDLSKTEKRALAHYRDLVGSKQFEWVTPSETNRPNKDCDALNSILRGYIKYDDLQDFEKAQFLWLCRWLSRSIRKSPIKKEITVYKGVIKFNGLGKYKTGATVFEGAYNSFTSSKEKAREYAEMPKSNKNDPNIIFVLQLFEDDYALYYDAREHEYLIDMCTKFYVIGKEEHKNHKDFGHSIIYYLRIDK